MTQITKVKNTLQNVNGGGVERIFYFTPRNGYIIKFPCRATDRPTLCKGIFVLTID